MARRKRRSFGAPRRLPSGNWQARVPDSVTGEEISLGTFPTAADAEVAIANALAERSRGTWIDPRRSRVSLQQYGTRWLEDRNDLRPRTKELYECLLRLHILPSLGALELNRITTEVVRSWNQALLARKKPGQITAAKAYRLLRTILNTAVQDEIITRNPCVLRGAAVERSPERPIASLTEVYALADCIDQRFRAVILLAAFSGMRLGEIQGLTRRSLNIAELEVIVNGQVQELRDGSFHYGPPKTDAGYRRIKLPLSVVRAIKDHLEAFPVEGPDAYLFGGASNGEPFRRSVLNRAWSKARKAQGLTYLHFHDLRHTGQLFAASNGANAADLMQRMGHSSSQASQRYLHASREKDAAIAEAMERHITASLPTLAAPIISIGERSERRAN